MNSHFTLNLNVVTDEWFHRPALSGEHVRLEPMTPEHAAGLLAAGRDPSVWTWLSTRQPADESAARALIETMLADGSRVVWSQVDVATGQIAGTTSYYDIDRRHRGVYIGHTWLGMPWQRTAVNTEAKLLLLTRAFDVLGAHRVGWHTDIRNERSQRAIERLGARREGVLRAHRVRLDGTLRDTVCYSVVATEWPRVRAGLRARLSR